VLHHRVTDGPALAFLLLTLTLIVGPRLAEKVRLPAMVGLVLAGMVIGPHVLNAIDAKEIALTALGTFGLLYLMFAAGLELDLKLFAKMKKAAITFAILSFVIPCTLGIVSARVLGYAWAGAVLMGSNWGSHTLVTYPMLREMGLSRNRAVGTVVGATAVTDTSALLVLTGVTSSVKGTGGAGLQAIEIAVGLAVLAVFTLVALPRIAHWFFASVGTESSYRFVFGMCALLAGAVLAQAASIDGIVGAFFAGLGLIRTIPERSQLMERVQFLGSALFIPIFLVSVGLLLDPKVLVDPKTLLVALVFTVAVLGGKALAAVIAGRSFHFTWPEVGVMSGLSGSQAAATLATTLVGARLKIFDKQTINAVLIVILLSLIITPAMVTYFGKRVPRVTGDAEAIGSAVLVPIYGEAARPLLDVAGRLAVGDGGIVLAASIVSEDAAEADLVRQRSLKDQANEWCAKLGLEARSFFRISRSFAAGLLQTIRAEEASLLIAEWKEPAAELEGDREAFELATQSPVPVVLTHGAVDQYDRVVVVEQPGEARGRPNVDQGIATELATRLGHGHAVTYVGPRGSGRTAFGAFKTAAHVEPVESPDPMAWVRDHTTSRDLVVFPGVASARRAVAEIPDLADKRFLVAIAANTDALKMRGADHIGGVIVGRSARPPGTRRAA
jgi:Kef-type K+ transport system membrane component KefB